VKSKDSIKILHTKKNKIESPDSKMYKITLMIIEKYVLTEKHINGIITIELLNNNNFRSTKIKTGFN